MRTRSAMSPNPQETRIELSAGPEDDGYRLDKVLARRLEEFSRSFLQQLVRNGGVAVNGATKKPSHKVRRGDSIALVIPALPEDRVEPENIPLSVLYEDVDLIVIDKPAGMVVHPSRAGASGTLANALMFHCSQLSDVNTPLRPGIVHRLDRDTTGAIAAAKTNFAHKELAAQFEARTVRKEYLAVVEGVVDRDEDVIETRIERDARMRERMRVSFTRGRTAVTTFRVEERFGKHSIVRAFPRTGRTHQIRVHLQFIGHPIVADSLYGRSDACFPSDLRKGEIRQPSALPLIARQALHARRLEFEHPRTGARMAFEAPLPADIACLWDALRANAGANA